VAEIIWHNEKRAIRELIPYEANPRQITDKQAKDLKASLAKFGIADPIIINTDNMIIGGHQRKKILETLLGYDPDFQIDVRVPDRELSIDEARELNVRLNKNVAEWDFDTLANSFELDDLLDWGFDKKELDLDLWASEVPEDVEPQIDKAEELRVKWGVESGQLWQLGSHRLICGDCTDKAVVERVMGQDTFQLMLTDPPYGVDYEGVTNDAPELLVGLLTDSFRIANGFMDNGGVYYICYPDIHSYEFAGVIRDTGWKQGRPPVVLWIKDIPVMGRGDYNSQNESMYYGWKGSGHYFSGKIYTNVWQFPRPKIAKGHPTMKPIGLFENAVENSSQREDIVYDPFLGSGTTLIACERLGRKCRAVEISPAYVAVAIQRWVDVTGKEPVLIGED